MKSQAGDPGFTLLEICVTVAVIGVLGLLSIRPMKHFLTRRAFSGSSNGIQSLIRTAQSRALANPNVHVGVHFDLRSRPQCAFAFLDETDPDRYRYDAKGDPAYLGSEELKKGLSFQGLEGYPEDIIFRGDGSAYQSLRIVLTDGTLKDTLDVLASTGRIRVGR